MLAGFFEKIWAEAYDLNDSNILTLLETDPGSRAIDIGCGDGNKTMKFAAKVGTKKFTGLDGVKERLRAARKRGVDARFANLEKKWPVKSEEYDVLVSNQVIEHMHDLDHFISEIRRILKPGGYAVISTENLASWHNIFALALGYQDFSHHLIKKLHVGNPLSPHHGQKTVSWSASGNSGTDDTAFPHVKIMTFKSLVKIFETYGFEYVTGSGSGYYPFFGSLGNLLSVSNPTHAHFITIKFRKL